MHPMCHVCEENRFPAEVIQGSVDHHLHQTTNYNLFWRECGKEPTPIKIVRLYKNVKPERSVRVESLDAAFGGNYQRC
jgi:hypothetical protein